ncbi:MAG TPA: T9SS type A sorting domain-containing protein, partial [Candidatus Paceibacterota bacterium]|nr:T9SS type A sorting domain-containing protein [Candidatus Paceibacterota bacterium]
NVTSNSKKYSHMKKLLSIFILTSLATSVFGQTWAPTGAKWYYNHYSGAQPYLTVVESIGDTIINTKLCKILKAFEINDAMDSTGAHHWDTLYCPLEYTYQDLGIVYLFDSEINNFIKLYDFNAIIGDTITVKDSAFTGYCPETLPFNLFQYVIDSNIDTTISGITLHKQFISPTQNSDWFFSDPSGFFGNLPIIERIGSLKYLFGVGVAVMEGPISCLRCYQDSILFYKDSNWPDSIPCDYLPQLPTNINDFKIINGINIFPNPATDQITIENKSNLHLEYSIINSNGQLYMTGIITSHLTSIPVDDLCAGIYNIVFRTDSATSTKHFIIEK